MILQDLLEYIKQNAADVSDLAAVADIERLAGDDPYRRTLAREMRSKYEDAAIEADRLSVFED